MSDRSSDQRVTDELALLQNLGDSRRVASFKAVLARTKLKPQPLPKPVRPPFVAAQPPRAPSADLEAAPSAD